MSRHESVGLRGVENEAQTSGSVLMVEPVCFSANPDTARSNAFQAPACSSQEAQLALREFYGIADRLEEAGVDVHRLVDTPDPLKPDAAFPNNWISFHADGTVVTYPMEAESRRRERRLEAVRELLEPAGFVFGRHVDLSSHENAGKYLEGTGSLILDRPRRHAYACLSSRTDLAALADFAGRLGYSPFSFAARDPQGRPIYHTNVMMSLGSRYALLCLDTVAEVDRKALIEDLEQGGRTLIDVGFEQLCSFACNIIELQDREGRALAAMSSAAHASLRPDQRRALEELAGEIVHAPIPMIEKVAGGSVRCMIADIHLPRQQL